MVQYPDFDIVDDLHQITMIETDEPLWPLIGGGREKIESALAVPATYAYYQGADLFAQAAILMGRLAAAHGYENGNKRTALAVVDWFLSENGYRLTADTVIENLLVTVVEANSNQADPEPLYETLTVAIQDRCTPIQFPSSNP